MPPHLVAMGVRLLKLSVVWVVVAVVVGIVVVVVHPPQNPNLGGAWLPLPGVPARLVFGCGLLWRGATGVVGVGIGLAWWNLPGTLLGFAAGLYTSRKSWLDFIDRPPE